MANVIFIRSRTAILVERFGKTLRDAKNGTLAQPLPERWVALIKKLNDEEKRERKPENR
jgi:hypothetical protein